MSLVQRCREAAVYTLRSIPHRWLGEGTGQGKNRHMSSKVWVTQGRYWPVSRTLEVISQSNHDHCKCGKI